MRALGGIVDVTAWRRAEEALRQAQKMEAVGQLTGGVAHDFNNLLAVVLGNLEILRKRLPDAPKLARLVDNAIEGAQRGASLTQRMLSFARRQDLRPEPVDVPGLVGGMEDLLRRSIGPRARIETRFPPGLPQAYADANQLELALLNLVVNARDAMPDGGTIAIAARAEAVGTGQASGLAPGRYVCLSVSDTGAGMDGAILGRAMEPFFTTKGPGKGTGLGLSMVHGLAEQSGGALALRSRVGEGTTAEIWLPVAAARRPAGVDAAGAIEIAAPMTPSLTVLAVDDEPLVLASTAAMLDELGHVVLEAGSGEKALDLVRAGRRIDLVITDQAMPGMTGLDLAEAIRAERPRMPILLATGHAGAGHAGAGQEDRLGLPRLGKPYALADLAAAVAACLERDAAAERVASIRAARGG